MNRIVILLFAPLAMSLMTGFGFGDKDPEKERSEIDQATSEILGDLYREVPGSESFLQRGAGYAVFSSLGVNVPALSTANGEGVAHYRDTREKVYMKMFSAGGGLGKGVKQFRLIFAFENRSALKRTTTSIDPQTGNDFLSCGRIRVQRVSGSRTPRRPGPKAETAPGSLLRRFIPTPQRLLLPCAHSRASPVGATCGRGSDAGRRKLPQPYARFLNGHPARPEFPFFQP